MIIMIRLLNWRCRLNWYEWNMKSPPPKKNQLFSISNFRLTLAVEQEAFMEAGQQAHMEAEPWQGQERPTLFSLNRAMPAATTLMPQPFPCNNPNNSSSLSEGHNMMTLKFIEMWQPSTWSQNWTVIGHMVMVMKLRPIIRLARCCLLSHILLQLFLTKSTYSLPSTSNSMGNQKTQKRFFMTERRNHYRKQIWALTEWIWSKTIATDNI